MIASQFNLDQRLAALLQTEPGRHPVQLPARESASAISRIAAAVRSLVGGSSAGRPARAAAR